jgi:hypothetical protein
MLTVKETAEYIHRSENFVRRTLKNEVPYHQRRVRGPMYFHPNDLNRWLA